MGLELVVCYPNTPGELWEKAFTLLANLNFPVQLRMIDGELAFPDEQPPTAWRELRLGTPDGMVTVRRDPGRLSFVTWGNADARLLQARSVLAWAFAEVTAGQVQTVDGPLSAAEFRKHAELARSPVQVE